MNSKDIERLSVQRACGLDTTVEYLVEFNKIIIRLDFFVSFFIDGKKKRGKVTLDSLLKLIFFSLNFFLINLPAGRQEVTKIKPCHRKFLQTIRYQHYMRYTACRTSVFSLFISFDRMSLITSFSTS